MSFQSRESYVYSPDGSPKSTRRLSYNDLSKTVCGEYDLKQRCKHSVGVETMLCEMGPQLKWPVPSVGG